MTTLNDVLNMNDSSSIRTFKLNPEWVALKKEIKQRKDEGLSTKRLENKLAKIDKKLPEPVKQSKVSEIKLEGKTYKYGKKEDLKTINQVAKKLKVNVDDLRKFQKDDGMRTFVKEATQTLPNGDVVKYNKSIEINIKDKKPLLLREFGIKRISTKDLIKTDNTIKRDGERIKIFKNLPDNIDIRVNINGRIKVEFSNPNFMDMNINFTKIIKSGSNINDVIKDYVNNELFPSSNYEIKIDMSQIKVHRNNQGGQSMKLQDMILRDELPPSISNLYSDVIENTNWKHCIHDYMDEIYSKRYCKKTIEKLNTTNDIYNFCVDKNLKMIAYDINGNCIMSNYPSKKNGYKNMIFIAHNNHLYPLKSKYLKKVNIIPSNIEIITDSNAKIIEILEQGRYVSDVKLNGSNIVSFIDGTIKYINNDEYLQCKEILAKFGLQDKIFDSISLITIGKTIRDLYITKCDKSLFINHEKFNKGGYNYKNDELEGQYTCYDYSKAYPAILSELPFLITCNMIKDDICNNIDLDENHYLYIAKPAMSSILLPDTNAYSGSHLKYCKSEGLEFTILEKLSCNRVDNHYTLMIKDLYSKLDGKTFKMIMNPFIGQFESSTKKIYNDFIKFCNDDELKTVDEEHYPVEINENLHMIYETKERVNLYNRKPIAIQIKDECRKKIYELMKKLKLNDNNIKSINTDCVVYVGDNKLKKVSSEMGQWKAIEYKEINSCFNYCNDDLSFKTYNQNNSVFGNCYAGCGKSYKVINEYIPNMNNDYIVLTPSHASVKEYKNLKLNGDVIQKYEYNNTVPNVSNIIIDEMGMCSLKAMTLLLKWSLLGKRILAYGDFKQLLPVGEDKPLLSSIFQHFVFGEEDIMNVNHRNNFSKEFYDAIIQGKCDNKKMIKKYNSITSNNVICYTNKTCDKYNQIIMNRLGIESIESIGCKVICNSNELRELNIYNKFQFTVTDLIDNFVILDNEYKVSRLCYGMYFEPAYARTIYSIQGESMESFYFPNEDSNYLNDRTTYTIISRLKGMDFNTELILK
jgi:hypothetical protein